MPEIPPRDDPFNLTRFITAQDEVYANVVAELKAGEKRTHWIWFIFPQVAGLSHSPTAQYYALQSKDEVEAYFAHPKLGARLFECTRAVLAIEKSAQQIFGRPDDLKFRSSMTLFEWISGSALFAAALIRASMMVNRIC